MRAVEEDKFIPLAQVISECGCSQIQHSLPVTLPRPKYLGPSVDALNLVCPDGQQTQPNGSNAHVWISNIWPRSVLLSCSVPQVDGAERTHVAIGPDAMQTEDTTFEASFIHEAVPRLQFEAINVEMKWASEGVTSARKGLTSQVKTAYQV